MWRLPVLTRLLAMVQVTSEVAAASVMRREMKPFAKAKVKTEISSEGEVSQRLILHQADSHSPVDGLLFTQGGSPFKADEFKKVCGASTAEQTCLQDLPIPLVRASEVDVVKILEQLPSVRYLSLQENMPHIIDMVKNEFDKSQVRKVLDAYVQSGIPIPAELSKELYEEQLGGSSVAELGEHENGDHIPADDDVTEEDPKTHQKTFNHHYVLHQKAPKAVVDGVLSVKGGKAFTTEQLDAICAADSDLIECVKGLPIIVVRASEEHLQKGLEREEDVQFSTLTESLPGIVRYLKGHMGLKDATDLAREYRDAGVPLPEKAIDDEFKKEHQQLKE
jgi:hypothetical protein